MTLTAETLFPVAAVPGLTRSDPHGPGITRERADGGFRYRDPPARRSSASRNCCASTRSRLFSVAAVPGLTRSDPHGPGITRERVPGGFLYRDPSGAQITSEQELLRIHALAIPPAWQDVWISPDPLGHIQATGVDSRGRTQYRYHPVWREQRDAQKFTHMLQFAGALPVLRSAAVRGPGRASARSGPGVGRRGAADRPRPVPHRRREVRRARPSLRRHHAAEERREAGARRGRVRLHRQGGQAPHDHRHRPRGQLDRAGADPQRQRPRPAVRLHRRRRAGVRSTPTRSAPTSPPARAATTRPRSSAPGTRPC